MVIQQAYQVPSLDDFNIPMIFEKEKKSVKQLLRILPAEISFKKIKAFIEEKEFSLLFYKTEHTTDTNKQTFGYFKKEDDYIVASELLNFSPKFKMHEYEEIYFYFSEIDTPLYQELVTFIKKNKKKAVKEKINYISMVYQDDNGNFKLIGLHTAKKKLTIDDNYNDDVIAQVDGILECLRNKEGKGLYLFHGIPGTGKTSFIKYLSQEVDRKHFIFIPNDMIGFITSPSFIPFLARNQGAVLILEDAEETLIARDTGRNVAISNILNITDGILSDLGIQIIATFNTKLTNIDKALLRAGRLKANIEFKALSIEKANALLKAQGKKETNKEITLAEVYNTTVIEETEQKSIGFKIQ